MQLKAYSILLYLIPEHPLADPEAFGSSRLNPLMLVERLDDQVPFDLLQGLGQAFLCSGRFPHPFGFSFPQVKREVLARDDFSATEDHGPFDKILQLPYIPRVRVAEEEASCFFGEIGDRFLIYI